MWWKIIIAIVCAVLLISPFDILTGVQIDDIIYVLGLIASVLSAVKSGLPSHQKDDSNDTNNF